MSKIVHDPTAGKILTPKTDTGFGAIRPGTHRMGSMVVEGKQIREPSGVLREAFVNACALVRDTMTAHKLIRAGLANGWRFRPIEGQTIELWAPGVWKPVTYTLRNWTLWRALHARLATETREG